MLLKYSSIEAFTDEHKLVDPRLTFFPRGHQKLHRKLIEFAEIEMYVSE